MAIIRQTSFASGELSPLLWGRTDLELFAHGARKLKNFVINRQGNAVARPGTSYVALALASQVRLFTYHHASGLAYVLCITPGKLRLYDAADQSLEAELSAPWLASDLPLLQGVQQGLSMVFTHPRVEPQEFFPGIPGFTGSPTLQPVRFGPPGETYPAASLGPVFPSLDGNPPAKPALAAWDATSLFVVDAEHPPREWQYLVATIVRNVVTGQVAETLAIPIDEYVDGDVKTGSVSGPPHALPADNLLVLYPDAPIYICPGEGTAYGASANWEPLEYVYYRGRGSLFGFIGSSKTSGYFADLGEEPNYLVQPLRGEKPFRTGEWPGAVGFFQQRRVFGGTYDRPSTLWTSAVDEFTNLDEPLLPWPGQPLEATLAGRRRELLQAMLQLDNLVVWTDSAAWAIGRADVALDYDTLASCVRVVDSVGLDPLVSLQPIAVDGAAAFIPRGRRGLRVLQPNGDAYQAVDASWHAEHLFRGDSSTAKLNGTTRDIAAWCYQDKPFGCFWLARRDGTLLSCTRTGPQTFAWARHDVGGQVLSLCAAPLVSDGQTTTDLVWMVVVRNGLPCLEVLSPDWQPVPRYATDPLYEGETIGAPRASQQVDSWQGVVVDKATGVTVSGLERLNGKQVYATCPGIEPSGPFTVTAGSITIPRGWGPGTSDAGTFYGAVGLPYVCDLELLDAAPGAGRGTQKLVREVGFEVDQAQGLEVGTDFSHLTAWRQRNVTDGYLFPSAASDYVAVACTGKWSESGRAVLRQAKPLPVTVLGITRKVDVGGGS